MSRGKRTLKIRCAIYTRKSSEEGLDLEFNSLDAQRESAEAFIASQKCEGWTCLPTRYDDGGFSGGNVERPGLQKLLADIETGEIDCIVVYKVDRLSRSLLDFARIMEIFERHNVSFVSVTQQFNTTHSMGRLTLNILLSFAQFEREIIGERIRDKIAAQRRKGKWTGGKPVLGYDVDRSEASPKLVVNAVEAARVMQIFEWYIELGSLLSVLKEINSHGWTYKTWVSKKGRPMGGLSFDKSSLHRLLTNPVYIGKIRHKEEVYNGEHEPIVDAKLFDEVQQRLRRNGNGQATRNKHGALLKGLLHCSACGRAMTHTFTSKQNRRYRYYACTRAINQGREACPTQYLPAAEIEAAVVDEIRGIGQDPALRAEVFQQIQAHHKKRLQKLTREQAGLRRDLTRNHAEIRRLVATGRQDSATAAQVADLYDRIAQAETRSGELAAQIQAAENDACTKADVTAALEDFDRVWDALKPREQARLLELLVAKVEFDAEESSMSLQFHPSAIKRLQEKR